MPRVITPSIIADFRNRLCEAAAQLLAEQGGFNMRELALRLRVSPMTAYRYFKDKNEILALLRARGFAQLADALDEASASFEAPHDTAAAVVRAYVRFALTQPVSYRLMFDLDQPPGGDEPARRQQRVLSVMDGVAQIAFDVPERSGRMLWSTLHGAVALHLAGWMDTENLGAALREAVLNLVGIEIEFDLQQIAAKAAAPGLSATALNAAE
jgi:AcrR family transcriptional regulator